MDIKHALSLTLERMKKGKRERPYVVGVSTVSLNNQITLERGKSSYSLIEFIPDDYYDKVFFPLRRNTNSIMVGTNTVVIDNPSLTSGTNPQKRPMRLLIDRKGRIPLNSNIFNNQAKTILVVTNKTPRVYVEMLKKKKNIKIVIMERQRIRITEVFKRLKAYGINSILVEGGGKLISSFIEKSTLDELWLQILPIVFPSTVSLFQMESATVLTLQGVFKIGNSIVCNYLLKEKR